MQNDIAVVESLSISNPTFYGHDNPVNREGSVELYDETLSLGAPLDKKELDTFKQQFVELLAPPGSEERRLMINRVEQYILALRAIKNAVGNPKFRGLNPSTTELGFGLIRPVFTISTALSPRIQWIHNWTVAYADWICAVGGGAGYGIGANFGLCVTHLKSFTTPTPVLAEVQVTVGRSQLLPIDVRNLRIGDTVNQVSIVPIPTIIALPTNTLYIRGRSDTAAATPDEVALGGLVFGLGRVLVQTVTYPLL